MTELRINDAARFLGVSDDTIRRWISDGKLTQHKDASNRAVVEGGNWLPWHRRVQVPSRIRRVSSAPPATDSPVSSPTSSSTA